MENNPTAETRRWRGRVVLAIRLILAAIMLYAALPKFLSFDPLRLGFEEFARSVYNYRILPVSLVNLVAFTIPPVEALGAVTLLTGVWLRAGSLMLALLQSVFLFGVARAWWLGLDITCGCFVGLDTKVGLVPLIRDSIFLAGFLYVFYSTFDRESGGSSVGAVDASPQDPASESSPEKA